MIRHIVFVCFLRYRLKSTGLLRSSQAPNYTSHHDPAPAKRAVLNQLAVNQHPKGNRCNATGADAQRDIHWKKLDGAFCADPKHLSVRA
jgi:hypothetical protein